MILTNDPSLKAVRSACLIVLVTLIAGCSSTPSIVIQDKKYEYRRAEQIEPLEVPPDLTSAGLDERLAVPDVAPRDSATFSAYSRERAGTPGGAVMVEVEGVRVERAGDQRWLVINASPERVWDATRRFWKHSGFLIKREDARLGILETEWHENRAAIPAGFIRGALGKVIGPLFSATVRDRFRVRLEPGEAGATELFLTHQGLEEKKETTGRVWRQRPADPELEAEMLYRMMIFWGIDQGVARAQVDDAVPQPERASLAEADGGSALLVHDGFARAWRRVGVALDRIGFAVEDRDRSRGLYLVRYHDVDAGGEKQGILARLAFWKRSDDALRALYSVMLLEGGDRTRIVVGDESGALIDNSTVRRILELLHEELR